ncbi:bark storage protein A-like [Malania oleifera]|uniref:bark storage protein A-like n=1 Tax=Malania oleifera TaxID=397392 RepID=UPI0025AE3FB4|nr:bark storage protein A-like [Malania oleifera]
MSVNGVQPCLVLLVIMTLTLVLPESATPLKKKFLNVIKQVNSDGPYVGLVTVISSEEEAFFATETFKPHQTCSFVDLAGRRFLVGTVEEKKVIYVRCGVGMVNAAAATQQMLDLFDVVGIIHFGIAGNANNTMSIGDVLIPKQVAHTGIWEWVNNNGTLISRAFAQLHFDNYNVPRGEESNRLGRIGYFAEELFSKSGKSNTDRPLFWAQTSQHWFQLAAKLEGTELDRCLNLSFCLVRKPKLTVGLKLSTANIFVDNAAYREFLFQTFQVSAVDMESSAVVMTSLSNGFPVIVIRALSDLAGGQEGQNEIGIFRPLAALNAAKTVVRFIRLLPKFAARH